MPLFQFNPHRQPGYRADPPAEDPRRVHRRLPGYAPTPLRPLPDLARRLGLGSLHLKDESTRLGLPAYKVLGAAWATVRVLEEREPSLRGWERFEDLARRVAAGPRLRLVTATDGNHGRGVARVARWLGLGAEVFVPKGTAPARIAAIESEGAWVTVIDGTYDATVAAAARVRGDDVLLLQDHGWPGYEEIPALVAQGYETILAEVAEEREQLGLPAPDVVLVQIGVGTLASAVVAHFRRAPYSPELRLVGVEPTGAACTLHSIREGKPVLLEVGAEASIMAGLNCGAPSSAAWPAMRDGMDAFVALEDERAREAMRLLAASGITAGESGAAGLAGLLELCKGPHAAEARGLLRLSGARVLLLSTEGATDPEAWQRIVGEGR
jgi:diaminopropionate ammonia-lyase